MRNSVKLLAAGLIGLSASAAQAVVVTTSALGVTTTSIAGATTVDFNDGSCGYASCTGNFQVVLGSVSGQYAQPAGTNTRYLSVPNPVSSGSATLSLGTEADYFGLYWGSIDNYNSISFYLAGSLVATYTGTDLVGQFANGNQVSYSSNRYINFDFGERPVRFHHVDESGICLRKRQPCIPRRGRQRPRTRPACAVWSRVGRPWPAAATQDGVITRSLRKEPRPPRRGSCLCRFQTQAFGISPTAFQPCRIKLRSASPPCRCRQHGSSVKDEPTSAVHPQLGACGRCW